MLFLHKGFTTIEILTDPPLPIRLDQSLLPLHPSAAEVWLSGMSLTSLRPVNFEPGRDHCTSRGDSKSRYHIPKPLDKNYGSPTSRVKKNVLIDILFTCTLKMILQLRHSSDTAMFCVLLYDILYMTAGRNPRH